MAREIIKDDIPKVKALLLKVFDTDEYSDLSRMGGLTNHTYKVTLNNGNIYVIRIPGEGTEEIIVRNDEKVSTKLACDLGIDAPLLYFGDDGSKVTGYIPNAITMSADTICTKKHLEQVADIFLTLHNSNVDTCVPFEVFDMAESYEKIIVDKKVRMFDNYVSTKEAVMAIKKEIDQTFDVKRVPCHNDPLCENWVEGDGKMYLIDWEYAGMNDGMWDIADVSIEAGLSHENDMALLSAYLKHEPTLNDKKHFLASKIYVDYLWTLWAKARVPYDGQPMEDWAVERYTRLEKFIKEYNAL